MIDPRQSDITQLWARLILAVLSQRGVRHVCIAPGSRSSPLTLAADTTPGITTHVHFDERGLGFYALGLAKASGQPVALITTSGTAVANLYPAVIEAAQTDLPLLVLSADRPPELIDCGANQAIRQPGIFADYPRLALNLPPPDPAIPASELVRQIHRAVDAASGCQAGPVHLNVPLREPLYPGVQCQDFSAYLADLTPLDHLNTRATAQAPINDEVIQLWQQLVSERPKGILIAGQLISEEADAVGRLATALNWPLIADIQSGLKHHPLAIRFSDQLLHHPNFKDQLSQCTLVLQFGGRLLSKRLQSWLEQRHWQHYWWQGRSPQVLDPAQLQTRRLVGEIPRCCQQLKQQIPPGQAGWAQSLWQADRAIARLLQQIDQGPLSELSVARYLIQQAGDNPLFVGNSLPIRLLEMFTAPEQSLTLYANRGASGIDGLLASAVGCHRADPSRPLTLLIGDMSLLHDLNSLMLLRQLHTPLVVVVLNNDGGNIFRMLPVPRKGQLLQRYYQLPHQTDLSAIAASMGLRTHSVADIQAFSRHYQQALVTAGATLLQVQVEPDAAPGMIAGLAEQIRVADLLT